MTNKLGGISFHITLQRLARSAMEKTTATYHQTHGPLLSQARHNPHHSQEALRKLSSWAEQSGEITHGMRHTSLLEFRY